MKKPERSPFFEAHRWVSFVTTIVFEMVLPVLLGIKLDEYCGTGLVFTVTGAVLGMVIAIYHLIRETDSNSDKS